jgi:hypothetical protein
VIGSGMFVHGGLRDNVQNDWSLFDFGLATWIQLKVFEEDGSEFKPFRKNHTMTSTPLKAIGTQRQASRLPWIKSYHDLMQAQFQHVKRSSTRKMKDKV